MPRTPSPASALSLAFLLASAACAPRARHVPTAPAPRPQAEAVPAAPVQAPEPIGESFEIEATADEPITEVSGDLLGNVIYDLPVEANRWVEMELDFLVTQRHAVIARWLERGDRWDEWVQDVFASYGLPRDLHHLAMVESGYQATVRSHAGAVGMWQFMRSTGRGMGLRIDTLVDERMDPVRATHAAARHLKQLHREFRGDWPLAAAAYNAGAGRINRGLGRFGVSSFWDLAVRGDLAQETRHYVPRLYAVTIIGRDPARFGFPAPQGVARKFAYDSMRVDVATPLSELARIGSRPLGELAELNPHLLKGTAPAGYWVWVPWGSGEALQQAFNASDFRRSGGYALYTLRRGEDVAKVAEAAGLTMERVRELNLSRNLDRVGRGDRIRLPASAVRALRSRPPERVARRDEDDEERRLRASSSRRSTDEGSTRAARSESSDEAENEQKSTRASTDRESSERTASRPSSERPTRSESRRESPSASSSSRRTHTVESGETLWGIARKYDVTVEAVREANDLGDRPLQPGQTLRIPRASGGPAERVASAEHPSSSSRQHVVKSGETLWSIARQYDSSVEAIRRANDMPENATLQPGQKLVVPRS